MPVKRLDAAKGRMLRLFTVKVKGVGEFDFGSKATAKQFRNEKKAQGAKVYLTTGPDHVNHKGAK